MSTIEQCAACGQGGDSLKTCNGCKAVKYCNAACQRAHRKQHKNDCKQRAAEFERGLYEIGKCAAELFDEILFKQPPRRDDCPICFLPLLAEGDNIYFVCCGKLVCCGCIFEMLGNNKSEKENNEALCPFCREQAASSDKESIERNKKRMEACDAEAFYQYGISHFFGESGLPQDTGKALEVWLHAAELGSVMAHYKLGTMYNDGISVETNHTKALYHYQQAALGGNELGRHNLGCIEANEGNVDRAMKHWMIAAGTGSKESLESIRKEYVNGNVTKSQFEKALRGYQKCIDEGKSDQRLRAKRIIEKYGREKVYELN